MAVMEKRAVNKCANAHRHRFSEPVGLDWRCRYCGDSMAARAARDPSARAPHDGQSAVSTSFAAPILRARRKDEAP